MRLWTFFAGSTAALLAAVTVMARARAAINQREQIIDLTLDESFPASDPPSWTAVAPMATPHDQL